MMKRFLILTLLLIAVVGCNPAPMAGFGAPYGAGAGYGGEDYLEFARTAEQRDSEFLAYQHTLVVDTSEDKLAISLKSVTDACAADRENQCTVLHSEINHGDYNSASITLRVNPEGVDVLANMAAGSGDVIRRSTNVEDLAKTITDIDKRTAILTTTRDSLFKLMERGADDIEPLIKITTELAKVQADLEQAMGQSAYQRQRINMDILNIQFVVEARRSFWGPVGESLSAFSQNLSEGLGDTINAIAYLLPWSILVFSIGYLLRKLWKRSRSS